MAKSQGLLKQAMGFLSCIMLLATILVSCDPSGPAPTATPWAGFPPSTASSMEVSRAMGTGWNLGNTMECCGSWITGGVNAHETAWGNPTTTRAMIHAISVAGFRSVRIPVAWSNMMAADGTIEPALLARVKEIADWVQEENMIAIVNLHWDSGWIAGFSSNWNTCLAKYRSIWTQVSAYLKDEDLSLILESLNEEGCWNDVWNGWDSAGKQTAYQMLASINQEFVNVVRSGGGNNPQRHLLIAGYATDIDKTCDALFRMPADPARRLMVSIHYYTPSTFAILTADASWGKNATTWGSSQEIQVLKDNMAKLKTRFIEQGIPVIMGEYGCPTTNKEASSVAKYISRVAREARMAGVCPMLWDNGEHFNRQSLQWSMPNVIEALQTSM